MISPTPSANTQQSGHVGSPVEISPSVPSPIAESAPPTSSEPAPLSEPPHNSGGDNGEDNTGAQSTQKRRHTSPVWDFFDRVIVNGEPKVKCLKHRVFEVSFADFQGDEDHSFRKIRLKAEDVQGKNVLTNFWGMDFTTDKLRSLVRKWQSLIEAHVDVKTTDNYTLRLFCIAFTKKRVNQQKRTCYAQSSQIRQVFGPLACPNVLPSLASPHLRFFESWMETYQLP
ncbi:40S ribosomal protein S3a-1, partial [Striga hermonthica]